MPPIKMIDQLPAFPDEIPLDDWQELRLGFAPGMVTLRRDGDMIRVITWGTADSELLQIRDSLAQALAKVGHGTVSES